MDLAAYFERIGFAGEARPDLATLRALHSAHLLAIPYENLDVQLGRPLTIDPAAAFDKLVTKRRGGWCYEMNGLLAAALEEIGFEVTRMAGAVMREVRGDEAIGNHLVLRVDLGEPWIADVGLGDGTLEPYRLRAGTMQSGGYSFALEALDDRWWRFRNHQFGGAPSFDVAIEPTALSVLADKCRQLQTAPDSIFRMNLICQRFKGDGVILQLLGRSLRTLRPGTKSDRILVSADELISVLAGDFGLDVPEAASLWPRICARHDEVLAAAAAATAAAGSAPVGKADPEGAGL